MSRPLRASFRFPTRAESVLQSRPHWPRTCIIILSCSNFEIVVILSSSISCVYLLHILVVSCSVYIFCLDIYCSWVSSSIFYSSTCIYCWRSVYFYWSWLLTSYFSSISCYIRTSLSMSFCSNYLVDGHSHWWPNRSLPVSKACWIFLAFWSYSCWDV